IGKYALIPDYAERPGLLIDCTRRLNGRLDEVADDAFTDPLSREFPYGATCVDRFLEVHASPPYFLRIPCQCFGRSKPSFAGSIAIMRKFADASIDLRQTPKSPLASLILSRCSGSPP